MVCTGCDTAMMIVRAGNGGHVVMGDDAVTMCDDVMTV